MEQLKAAGAAVGEPPQDQERDSGVSRALGFSRDDGKAGWAWHSVLDVSVYFLANFNGQTYLKKLICFYSEHQMVAHY